MTEPMKYELDLLPPAYGRAARVLLEHRREDGTLADLARKHVRSRTYFHTIVQYVRVLRGADSPLVRALENKINRRGSNAWRPWKTGELVVCANQRCGLRGPHVCLPELRVQIATARKELAA